MLANWEKIEKIIANLIGGKRTPGSGNGHIKGDIVQGDWMIECKSTIKDKISLCQDWFQTLEKYIGSKEVLLVVSIQEKIVVFEPDSHLSLCKDLGKPWKTQTLKKTEAKDGMIQGDQWIWRCHEDGYKFLKEISK